MTVRTFTHKSTTARAVAIITAMLLTVAYLVATPTPTYAAETTYNGYTLKQAQKKILDQTNAARKKAGLPALKASPKLNTIAVNWSKKQAAAGKMSHNPNIGKEVPSAGRITWAENVAYGYTVDKVVNAWMNSKGHKANILGKNNQYLGVGLAMTKNGTIYFTQVFAGYKSGYSPDKAATTTVKYKTTAAVALRAKATTNSTKHLTIPKGVNIGVAKGTSGVWKKFTYKGKTGWVHTKYLKKT